MHIIRYAFAIVLALVISEAAFATAGSIVTVTGANYTVDPTNRMVFVDPGTLDRTITLPPANAAGHELMVIVTDPGAVVLGKVTVVAPGGGTTLVDFNSAAVMTGGGTVGGKSIRLFSDGTGKWYVSNATGAGGIAGTSAQINGAAPVANAALSILGDNTNGGHIQSQQTTAPTGDPFPGASAAVVVSVTLANATDVAGQVNFTYSGPSTAGDLAHVLFNKPYVTPPIIVLTPADMVTAVTFGSSVGYFVVPDITGLGFSIGCGSVVVAGAYSFFYHVIETQ